MLCGSTDTEESSLDTESRTLEIGLALHRLVDAYSPPPTRRLQDRLMLTLMRRLTLRTRVLRLVDVLAALPEQNRSHRAAVLVREYLRSAVATLSPWQYLPLRLALSGYVPDAALARMAEGAVRLTAGRFVAAPSSAGVDGLIAALQRHGRYPSLDLLGEAVLSDEEAEEYKQGYLRMLRQLGGHPLAGKRTPGGSPALEVSLKLSALTPEFNPADPTGTARRARPALEELFDAARQASVGVTIDAEQFMYRDLTWHILREVISPGGAFADWTGPGLVVQTYLQDADAHLRDVARLAESRPAPLRVRLVKGAYWDHEVILAEQQGYSVPVFRAKYRTDQAFERLTREIITQMPGIRLAVASHNVRAHAHAEAIREAQGLPEGAIEHQTLFHTLEGLSRALPQMGWVARDYVPVGDLVPGMAYLVRRVLENTSQAGFLVRERLHEDPVALLKPPQEGPEDFSYQRRPYYTGFLNTPAAPLFDSNERHGLQQALEAQRRRFGEHIHASTGGRASGVDHAIPSRNPSHPEEVLAWVDEATAEDADDAIALANAGFAAWAGTPLARRVEVGLQAAALLRERRFEAAAWVIQEGGRTWPEAMADVEEAIDHIEWNARQLESLSSLLTASFNPRGVVACIPPWNFPLALPAGMTSAALLVGNAVILKPAEQAQITAKLLVDVFHSAGVPKDALLYLPGRGETVGARLVESPEVDMVAFTGSLAVGLGVYRTSAEVRPTKGGLKRTVTEMGGKNAIAVFPDADLDEAIEGILASAFGHAGQKCSACSRLLVHRDIHNRLMERLVSAARSLPLGPAEDPGTVINPLIDAEAAERVRAYGRVAREEGQVLLDSLESPDRNPNLRGPLIVELSPERATSARIGQEEIFGPVLTVVPFSDEEQAVHLANDVPYGLTFGLFSRSLRTISRMVRKVQAGNIYVNRKTTGARVGVEPFGGYKLSGTGPKAGGEEYLIAFVTRAKGFRSSPPGEATDVRRATATGVTLPRAWSDRPAPDRVRCLRAALIAFARSPEAFPAASRDEFLTSLRKVLDASAEITDVQPAAAVPGQDNTITWETPLGTGLVAGDGGANPALVAAFAWAALIAGNGVLLFVPDDWRPAFAAMVDALHGAGVPADVAGLAPLGVHLEEMAAHPIHYAAVDLGLDLSRPVYEVLGVTRPERGQHWLKKLIHAGDGLHPGEPGFLRQFAHPKAISILTLRHGTDLALGEVQVPHQVRGAGQNSWQGASHG